MAHQLSFTDVGIIFLVMVLVVYLPEIKRAFLGK